MNEYSNARCIKALFIDNVFFHDISDKKIIGSEVMFSSNKVIADLIILSNRTTVAFEIKAKNDDLRKLNKQLDQYNKVFDFVNVIITENHFDRAESLIPKVNGIILLLNDYKFETYREPLLNTNLEKSELLATMPIKFIKEHYKISSSLSAIEVRQALIEQSCEDIKNKMYDFLYNRISSRFEYFQSERGVLTHFEDISMLSMPKINIILQ